MMAGEMTIQDALLKVSEYLEHGDYVNARKLTEATLIASPDNPDILNLLGKIQYEAGDHVSALSYFEKAAKVNPKNTKNYADIAVVLAEIGNTEQAIKLCERSLKFVPDDPVIYQAIASLYMKQNNYVRSLENAENAVKSGANNIELYKIMASSHYFIGNYETSQEYFNKAYDLSPSDGLRVDMALLLPAIMESHGHIIQIRERFLSNLDKLIKERITLKNPEKEISIMPFYQGYHGLNNKELMRKMAEFFEIACPSLLFGKNCHQDNKERKIRIGFVSEYFYKGHVVSSSFIRLIELLSKEDKFEIYVFSSSVKRDSITDKIAGFGKYLLISHSLQKAREIIASQEIDFLLYLDIGMNTFTYFLAFSRLAPVQCTIGGHPITSGIKNIDYYLSSEVVEPENGQEHYTEKLVEFNSIACIVPKVRIPDSTETRRELGLPENIRLYSCPVHLFKIHPDMDQVFKAILERDKEGLILLFDSPFKTEWADKLRERLSTVISAEDLDRIAILPYAQGDRFIHILQNTDAVLDCFHFSFGTTAYMLFAAGIPFVTLLGEFMRGRAGYGFYKIMGITDLIAENEANYVDLAIKLASDKSFRENISERIKQHSDILFDNHAIAAEIKEFIRKVTGRLP